MTDIFKKATKQGLTFDTSNGILTVQELWQVPLTGRGINLDSIAKGINKKLKEADEESFVNTKSTANTKLTLMLDIVKDIISDKLADQDKAAKAKDTKAQKELIASIIAKKQNQKLEDMSLEDLEKMIATNS
jgi:hypothetical protein